MNFRLIFAFGVAALAASATCPLRAEEPVAPAANASPPAAEAPVETKPAADTAAPVDVAAPAKEVASATDAPPEPREEPKTAKPGAAEASRPDPRPETEAPPAPVAAAPVKTAEPSPSRLDIPPVTSAEAEALKKALAAIAAGSTDEDRNERAALLAFYEARAYASLWIDAQARFTAKGAAAAAESGAPTIGGLRRASSPCLRRPARPRPKRPRAPRSRRRSRF